MDELTNFLRKQKILQIAPAAGDPWIANVLMCSKSPKQLFFIGSKNTLYGQRLLKDPSLAFATAWVEDNDHLNRKGIQGVGAATLTENEDDILNAVSMHNSDYPEFAERITPDWIKTNERGSGVWVIKPTFIKFWNDELYGTDGSEEFHFE